MTFTQAIRTCLQKYVMFSGRASRPEFWWFALFFVLAKAGASWLNETLGLRSVSAAVQQGQDGASLTLGFKAGILDGIVLLAVITPLLAVGARRVRDAGFWGGLIFAPIAAVSAVIALILLISAVSGGSAAVPAPLAMLLVLGSFGLTLLALVQKSRGLPDAGLAEDQPS